MISKAAIIVAALSLTVLVCSECADQYGGMSSADAHRLADESAAYSIMKSNEYLDILKMTSRLVDHGSLSATDVDWLLSVAHRPGTPYQEEVRIYDVAMVFAAARHKGILPEDREKVFDFAVSLAARRSTNAIIPKDAIYIFIHLRDKRAIPYLTFSG